MFGRAWGVTNSDSLPLLNVALWLKHIARQRRLNAAIVFTTRSAVH